MVAAAAAVLAAGYFVPSASASSEQAPTTAHTRTVAHTGSPDDLADTGAFNTKPYLIGGSVFLVVGAGLLAEATRRSRQSSDES